MRRLGAAETAFLYGETPAWHMHVAALMIADPSVGSGEFSFERLQRLLIERLPELPQFRWKCVQVPFGVDRPVWVEEPELDPDAHIRRVVLPPPGGARELGALIGRLLAMKLNRSRPLWEMWVIEGLENGRVAVLDKAHHAIIDGVSGSGLNEILMDLTSEPRAPTTVIRDPLNGRMPGAPELLARGIVTTATQGPLRLARLSRQLVRQSLDVVGFARGHGFPDHPYQAPRTSLNAAVTGRRSFTAVRLPLSRAQNVKRAARVTLNDVMLALSAAALRHYLLLVDDLPRASLVAQCPVSLRTDADKDAVGVRVGSIFTSLATDISDPLERLETIHIRAEHAKEMRRKLAAHQELGFTEIAPPAAVALAARLYTAAGLDGRTPPPVNVVISNVPGPPFPLYIAGAPVEAMYPMGPLLLGMGVNITVVSYNHALDIGIISCPDVVTAPEWIAQGFPLALLELEEALGIATTRDRSGAKP